MKKHPLNKRIRSSVPTEADLTSPNARVRHRAIVRLGSHRNMVKGAANRQGPHDGHNRVAVPHYSDLTISREATPEDYVLFFRLFPTPQKPMACLAPVDTAARIQTYTVNWDIADLYQAGK